MTSNRVTMDLGDELGAALPYLRRYARALTGAQSSGDRYALAALEAIVADPASLGNDVAPKVGLFRAFHKIWSSSGGALETLEDTELGLEEELAQWRLSGLTETTREALLLHTIEEFSFDDVGKIVGVSAGEAEALVERAMADIGEMVAGKVLVIEDEAIIAMDLQAIVGSMGHRVTGVARTYDGALRLGEREVPDLILADIQLADKSSGIDAVNALLKKHGERPVIFITAFPERLLTGERPEPAFLITKPYSEDQVRAAVSQAMFFATTKHMSNAL